MRSLLSSRFWGILAGPRGVDMLNLQFNTRVRISVPGQGAAIGRVEDIRPPAEMPDLAGFTTRGEFSPRGRSCANGA